MGLDTTFIQGNLFLTGYPHPPGRTGDILTQESAFAREEVDNIINIMNFETWSGNSGGPVWRMGGERAYVVGIVSTGAVAFDIDPFYDTFLQLIRTNDHHIVA